MYWTDGSLMRYVDFEDLPWREVADPENDFRKIKVEGELDCNKLMVQPKFSIPEIEVESVVEGGNIREGSYQFVAQYANELGESYTAFYNPTNTISIKEGDRATQNFDLTTNKAINVTVSGLDNSGIFDYFNLIVIETINGISTNKLIGTYPIADNDYTITYDGLTGENIQISSIELFQRYQHYDMADGVTTSDDRIIWYGLKKRQRTNYQQIWSKVKLYWQSFKIPYTDSEAYNNPLNTYDYRGYMRDEVYPVEGCFILSNGEQTDNFVLVGRKATSIDNQLVSNFDATAQRNEECDTPEDNKRRWEVYNTALVLGTDPNYDPNDSCYKGPYQYGEFSYWESNERYPNNKEIWGDLSGAPIRHFKFPDELVTPRFTVEGDKEFIYPLGIKLDIDSLRTAINDSDIPQTEKDRIVGFKIFRGDRSSGNMSIKAKGHFTNVGKYDYDGQEYYFANYPYNDLGEDPLFAIKDIEDHSDYKPGLALKPFEGNQGRDQFVFHSPDTHFGRVGNIDSGYLKLEAIDYGKGKGNFVKVKNNAEYKFTTRKVTMTAAVLATGVAFDVSKNGSLEFNGSDFAQTFNNIQELMEKLIPYQNLGFNINSIAEFNKSYPIPNSGFKIRQVSSGKYLSDGYHSIEEGKTLNHFRRESAVYLNTEGEFNYAHQYSPIIPEDSSRFIYTTARTLDNSDMTDQEIFEELSKSNVRSATAVIYGIFAAADELSGGSENLKTVLIPYLTHLFQPYLQTANYNGLEQLINVSEDCINNGEPRDPFPNSALNIASKQNIYVRDYDGTELIDWRVGEKIRIPGLTDAVNDTDVVFNNVTYLKTNEDIVFKYYDDDYQATLSDSAQVPGNCDPDVTGYDDCLLLRGIGFFDLQLMLTQTSICGGDILSSLHKIYEYAKDAYFIIDEPKSEENLSKIRSFDVNAYYGALKQYLPAQWGRVYSYQLVDTGSYTDIGSPTDPIIFGGDTYINKFSFKTKLPVFTTNLVGEHDQKDVALDEDGNLGYPMFYLSTKPQNFEYNLDQADLNTSFEGIGVTLKNKAAGSVLQTIGTSLMVIGGVATSTIVGSLAGVIIAAVGGVIYIVGSIFSNIGNRVRKAMIRIYKDLLRQIIDNFGVKNVNLDNSREGSVSESGMLYQYVYGNPVYFVESQVNVDYRQATNDNEGNFYPRVGTGIPNDWLQEDRVPIINDNTYHYNKSYSKQNKETPYTHLPENFDSSKECQFEFPNRAFWSEKSSLNETLNNWLIYKPVSRYDFPKSFGSLTSLDGVLNKQVIARFTNKTQIYNALTTVDTSTFQAFLGNDKLFSSAPPVDLTETDTGSLGSQHKFLLKTPHGIIFTDVKRGQVILLRGTTPNIISNLKVQKWFKRYLASDTLQDNHFNGEGITGVYDEFYDRLILTKKGSTQWTISFSFKTNTWVSWHSYIPNFYIGHTDYFQSSNNDGQLWSHNKTHTTFTNFYGEQSKYILEYPYTFKIKDEVVQSFRDYTTALRYEDYDTPVEEQNTIYFNKAIVYNTNQTTGTLNLIPKPKNSLKAYKNLSKFNTDSKDILLSKTDHIYNFNDIVDIVKDRNKAIFLSNSHPVNENLEFIYSNLEYGKRSYKGTLLRSKDARVRLILDDKDNYKLISHVTLLQTQESDL